MDTDAPDKPTHKPGGDPKVNLKWIYSDTFAIVLNTWSFVLYKLICKRT